MADYSESEGRTRWQGIVKENVAIEKGDGTGQIAASCPVTITCVCHESRWCIRSRLARSRASAESEFSLYVSPRSVFVSVNRLSLSLSLLLSLSLWFAYLPAFYPSLSRALSRSLSFDHTLVTPLLYFPSNASIVLARTFTIGRLSIFIRRVACASDCASLLALVLALSRERECLTCEVSKTGVPSYVLRHCATRPTRSPTLCHYAGFRGSLSRGEGRARASELASVQRRGRARGKR